MKGDENSPLHKIKYKHIKEWIKHSMFSRKRAAVAKKMKGSLPALLTKQNSTQETR